MEIGRKKWRETNTEIPLGEFIHRKKGSHHRVKAIAKLIQSITKRLFFFFFSKDQNSKHMEPDISFIATTIIKLHLEDVARFLFLIFFFFFFKKLLF